MDRPADVVQEAVEAFASWLEGEFTATGVNLHAIDVVADLRIMRLRYIKMCGDMAKHNLARIATNAGHLRKLLDQAGHPVSISQAEFRMIASRSVSFTSIVLACPLVELVSDCAQFCLRMNRSVPLGQILPNQTVGIFI